MLSGSATVRRAVGELRQSDGAVPASEPVLATSSILAEVTPSQFKHSAATAAQTISNVIPTLNTDCTSLSMIWHCGHLPHHWLPHTRRVRVQRGRSDNYNINRHDSRSIRFSVDYWLTTKLLVYSKDRTAIIIFALRCSGWSSPSSSLLRSSACA